MSDQFLAPGCRECRYCGDTIAFGCGCRDGENEYENDEIRDNIDSDHDEPDGACEAASIDSGENRSGDLPS